VEELATRLYEAQQEARKQTKLSHEVAKKYYDRKTKEIKLKKGELVYLYNPEKGGRLRNSNTNIRGHI
jgi:hypothetical protein